MGTIGRDTPVRELDLEREAVRRELVAMLPVVARAPLIVGGLPAPIWFEQFDEEDLKETMTVGELLMAATIEATAGCELTVYDRPKGRFDPRRTGGAGVLVVDLRCEDWSIDVALDVPGAAGELEDGQVDVAVDASLDRRRWAARARTRGLLRDAYLRWQVEHRLDVATIRRELEESISWEERLERLFPAAAAEAPRPAEVARPDGPEEWAYQRWLAVTGESPAIRLNGPMEPVELECELLLGALADYARGILAVESAAA